MTFSLEQHNIEIYESRELWKKKAGLRIAYSQFYRDIAARIDPTTPGLIVELGSGMGNVKDHIPECITTDLFPNPWLDRVENAYALSFEQDQVADAATLMSGTISNIQGRPWPSLPECWGRKERSSSLSRRWGSLAGLCSATSIMSRLV